MKKIIVLWCALLCTGTTSIAQFIICNIENGARLQGAVAEVFDDKGHSIERAVSDASGVVSLTPNAIDIKVVISYLGFQTIQRKGIPPAGEKVYLSLLEIPLSEVLVSAARFAEPVKDVAQQVQVISAKDIRFQNQQTSADLLMQSGNVLVQKSQQGGGSPVIRGFEANKVLIVVDGVRMNNAIYRGGHLQNVITLDQNALDRVEVLFGPGSVMYGSDALGGVMHFYTKNPILYGAERSVTGSAFTRFASANNEATTHVDFNISGKKWASLSSITASLFADLRAGDLRTPGYDSFGRRYWYVESNNGKDSIVANSNPNLQVGTAYSQLDILQKVMFQPKLGVRHLLNLQLSTSSNVPRYDRLTEGAASAPVFAEWYYGPQQRFMASYQLHLDNPRQAYDRARITAAAQRIEESRYSRAWNSQRLSNRVEEVWVYSVNADFQKQKGKHELRYGAELTHNDVQSTAFRLNISSGARSFLNSRYPDGGSTMRTAAVYAADTWEINEFFTLNAGIRASNVALQANIDSTDLSVNAVQGTDTTAVFFLNNSQITQNNTALNGQLGLIFHPGKKWRFSVLYSSGFRAPNVDDVGKLFDPPSGGILLPNGNLKPEFTHNVDLGVQKSITDLLEVQATGFYTLIRNAITMDNATLSAPNGLPYDDVLKQPVTNVNKDRAYIYGASANVVLHAGKFVDVSSSINYTVGRIVAEPKDTPLDHIPPTFGRTCVRVTGKKIQSEFWLMYNGWKRLSDYRLGTEDNEEYATENGMPAWYTLNVRAQYYFTPSICAQVALENMLNQHYRVFASGTSGAGRNLVMSVRVNF